LNVYGSSYVAIFHRALVMLQPGKLEEASIVTMLVLELPYYATDESVLGFCYSIIVTHFWLQDYY